MGRENSFTDFDMPSETGVHLKTVLRDKTLVTSRVPCIARKENTRCRMTRFRACAKVGPRPLRQSQNSPKLSDTKRWSSLGRRRLFRAFPKGKPLVRLSLVDKPDRNRRSSRNHR